MTRRCFSSPSGLLLASVNLCLDTRIVILYQNLYRIVPFTIRLLYGPFYAFLPFPAVQGFPRV